MRFLGLILWLAFASGQPQPLAFPAPASQAETIANTTDFPYLPPLAGARLVQTSRVASSLELKSATADDEAVLAGTSYIKKRYERIAAISSTRFVPS